MSTLELTRQGARDIAFNSITVPSLADPFTANSYKVRDELLESSKNIERVAGAKSQEIATDILGQINAVISAVEAMRKKVKEPVLSIGKLIDGAASKFVVDLENEKARLRTLLSTFQVEQDRIEQEAKRKQEEAIQKARLEQERIAREAELARQREEEARQAAVRAEEERVRLEQEAIEASEREEQARMSAANPEADDAERIHLEQEVQRAAAESERIAQEQAQAEANRKAAEEEAERQRIVQHAAEEENRQVALAAANALTNTTAPRASGMVVKTQRNFEVTDIHALYAFNRGLVKMEPSTSVINAIIRAPGNEKLEIPGLRITETTEVNARAR